MCVCVTSDKQRAELTQQHTEWSKQMTQRHMKQIEDLQDQLQAHTQMMALQQVTHTHTQTHTGLGLVNGTCTQSRITNFFTTFERAFIKNNSSYTTPLA